MRHEYTKRQKTIRGVICGLLLANDKKECWVGRDANGRIRYFGTCRVMGTMELLPSQVQAVIDADEPGWTIYN